MQSALKASRACPLALSLPDPGNYPHHVYAEYVAGSSPLRRTQ